MKCSSSSCGSGCGTPLPCPCPPQGNPAIDSLEKVLNCYWASHQELAVERTWYAELPSLGAALDEAAQALLDENRVPGAPEVVTRPTVAAVRERLQGAETELAACPDFEALHEVVTASLAALPGLTTALLYLTSLRIGLQRGLAPRLIRLEEGAREGAAALAEIPPGVETLSRESLPAIFRHPDLPTEEVQGCLCVCRHQLRWLAANGRLGE